mmetsp:Transcript_3602/g.13773  ORF Transcript_3602/g.13773 Transcript_3602/m.13773 type:complete len:102 (-) Transcript_3602:408-713(-)
MHHSTMTSNSSSFSLCLSFSQMSQDDSPSQCNIITSTTNTHNLSSFIDSIEKNVDELVSEMEKTIQLEKNDGAIEEEKQSKRGLKRKSSDRSPEKRDPVVV